MQVTTILSFIAVLVYLKSVHREAYTVGLTYSYEKPDIVIRAPST